MNEYEEQAKKFLEKYDFGITSSTLGSVHKWGGRRYVSLVSIFRNSDKRKSMTFNFHGSTQDFENKNETVTEYDILSCLSSDSNYTTVEDLRNTYGQELPYNKAEILKFGRRINQFFTEEELEDLRDII